MGVQGDRDLKHLRADLHEREPQTSLRGHQANDKTYRYLHSVRSLRNNRSGLQAGTGDEYTPVLDFPYLGISTFPREFLRQKERNICGNHAFT